MKKLTTLFLSFILLLVTVFTLAPSLFAESAPSGSVVVNYGFVYSDTNVIVANNPLGSISYGTQIDFPDEALEGYNFVYYVVNGIVRTDLSEGHIFNATTDLNIVAVYKQSGYKVALFVDSNGAFLGVDYLSSEQSSATPPATASLIKPGYISLNTWSGGNTSNVTTDTVFVLQYELDENVSQPEILVVNASLDITTPNYNEIVTATGNAANGYWMEDGIIVAYGQTYEFSAIGKRQLIFVEDLDVIDSPVVHLVDVSGIRSDMDSYLGQIYLPDGYSLVEYGFLFNEERALLNYSSADVKLPSGSLVPSTKEFLRSTSNEYASVRAYAVINNGLVNSTIYSQRNTGYASDLFISEYVEGSSSNKALEIYNGTGYTVDLSNYSIKLFTNGSSSAGSTLVLTGNLNNADTYVIGNASASQSIKDLSDILDAVTGFNGDDAIGLYKNDVLVDQFGIIGVDPGTNWSVDTEDTVDNTLIRKPGIFSPSIEWIPEQWEAYSIDTISDLGSHLIIEISDLEKATFALDDLNLPESLVLETNYSLQTTGLYGALINWSTSDANVIDNNGNIIRPDFGQLDATATLSYTLSVGTAVLNGQIAVTVKAKTQSATQYVDVYTFTSSSWGASKSTDGGSGTSSNWTSGKSGNQFQSGRGIQVTSGASGANGTSVVTYDNIVSIEVFYSTNTSSGAGTIITQIGATQVQNFTVTTSGGITNRSAGIISTNNLSGTLKITVNCTTNSIYIHSIKVTYLE